MPKAARILIVEDEANVRQALVDYFRFSGDYDVRFAAAETEAILIGRDFKPHILISDWILNGDGEGIAVAKALSEANPQMGIILFSGFPLGVLKERCRGIPVTRFIEKPISFQVLIQALDEVLATSKVSSTAE